MNRELPDAHQVSSGSPENWWVQGVQSWNSLLHCYTKSKSLNTSLRAPGISGLLGEVADRDLSRFANPQRPNNSHNWKAKWIRVHSESTQIHIVFVPASLVVNGAC